MGVAGQNGPGWLQSGNSLRSGKLTKNAVTSGDPTSPWSRATRRGLAFDKVNCQMSERPTDLAPTGEVGGRDCQYESRPLSIIFSCRYSATIAGLRLDGMRQESQLLRVYSGRVEL
jgi:hypothetical protein